MFADHLLPSLSCEFEYQQTLQCSECGYAHAVQLKQYHLLPEVGWKESCRYQLLTGWYHREAPGTALQGLLVLKFT